MRLAELQRRMAAAVMQPLDASWRMGSSSHGAAVDFIQPNRRLKAGERLEIYNRSYWFRLFDAFYEDFPALRAVIGERRFRALTRAYLTDCPSRSYTLRNLGSQLLQWLETNRDFIAPNPELGMDVARLEWAEIEAFDGEERPPLSAEALKTLTPDSRLTLQPHLQLIEVRYPVDDLRIAVNKAHGEADDARAARQAARRFMRSTPKAVHLAVYRHELTVFYRRLEPKEFLMLERLRRKRSLEQALAGMQDRLTEVQQWLAAAAELGWICE